MNIKELSQKLEEQINIKLFDLQQRSESVKELNKQMDKLYVEIYDIIDELRPVEQIVLQNDPKLVKLFNAFKDVKVKK